MKIYQFSNFFEGSVDKTINWSHTQVQMGNGVQPGFPIDITLRKDT